MKRLLYATLIALCCLIFGTASAWADEGTESPDPAHVYLIVAPGLQWADITNEQTPTLQSLVGHYACANVIAHDQVKVDSEAITYTRMNDAEPKQVDEYVYNIYKSLKSNESIIITSSPSFAKHPFELQGYGIFIMVDAGDNGLLQSGTVRRSGLITSDDAGAALHALATQAQRNPAKLSIYPLSNYMSALGRSGQLAHDDSVTYSVDESQPEFMYLFLVWLGVTFLTSAALLSLEIKIRPRFLEYLLPISRILWIITLAFPLATYLMFWQLPSLTTPEITFDFFGFVVMEISFVALLIALVFRWYDALLFILAATVSALALDPILGGPMTLTGYLSYSPAECVRYYGIGNEGCSLLFGSWMMLSSLLLNRYKESSFAQHFRTWIFPLASLFILVDMVAPWWGANFGGIIWGTVGVLVAWLLFNKRRVNVKMVLGMIGLSALLAVAVLLLDTTYNVESHMGAQINALTGQWFAQIVQVLIDMLKLSWQTIAFSPALALCFLLILFFLVSLRVVKPGLYQDFWTNNTAFKGGYTALLITSFLMLFIEDSGILMPALVLLYPMCGLLWLICDHHSWHIRTLVEHKHRRELASLKDSAVDISSAE